MLLEIIARGLKKTFSSATLKLKFGTALVACSMCVVKRSSFSNNKTINVIC